jgi:hypothetical protein
VQFTAVIKPEIYAMVGYNLIDQDNLLLVGAVGRSANQLQARANRVRMGFIGRMESQVLGWFGKDTNPLMSAEL